MIVVVGVSGDVVLATVHFIYDRLIILIISGRARPRDTLTAAWKRAYAVNRCGSWLKSSVNRRWLPSLQVEVW